MVYLEESVELSDKQLLSTSKVITCSHAQGKVRVLEHVADIGNNILLVHTHTKYLQWCEKVSICLFNKWPDNILAT